MTVKKFIERTLLSIPKNLKKDEIKEYFYLFENMLNVFNDDEKAELYASISIKQPVLFELLNIDGKIKKNENKNFNEIVNLFLNRKNKKIFELIENGEFTDEICLKLLKDKEVVRQINHDINFSGHEKHIQKIQARFKSLTLDDETKQYISKSLEENVADPFKFSRRNDIYLVTVLNQVPITDNTLIEMMKNKPQLDTRFYTIKGNEVWLKKHLDLLSRSVVYDEIFNNQVQNEINQLKDKYFRQTIFSNKGDNFFEALEVEQELFIKNIAEKKELFKLLNVKTDILKQLEVDNKFLKERRLELILKEVENFINKDIRKTDSYKSTYNLGMLKSLNDNSKYFINKVNIDEVLNSFDKKDLLCLQDDNKQILILKILVNNLNNDKARMALFNQMLSSCFMSGLSKSDVDLYKLAFSEFVGEFIKDSDKFLRSKTFSLNMILHNATKVLKEEHLREVLMSFNYEELSSISDFLLQEKNLGSLSKKDYEFNKEVAVLPIFKEVIQVKTIENAVQPSEKKTKVKI